MQKENLDKLRKLVELHMGEQWLQVLDALTKELGWYKDANIRADEELEAVKKQRDELKHKITRGPARIQELEAELQKLKEENGKLVQENNVLQASNKKALLQNKEIAELKKKLENVKDLITEQPVDFDLEALQDLFNWKPYDYGTEE